MKVIKANVARVIGKAHMSKSYTTRIRGWHTRTPGYRMELLADGAMRVTYFHGDFASTERLGPETCRVRLCSRLEALRERFAVEVDEAGEALIVREK